METKENKGVTLIALAVTIIVMLILAGVTISALTGNSGITTKAKQAKMLSEAKTEEEAIRLVVTYTNMQKNIGEENIIYLGEPLHDKDLVSGDKWKVILDTEKQEKYGTGWYFIEKNTEIEKYGKTKNERIAHIVSMLDDMSESEISYIEVNYEEGQINQLEEDKYMQISYANGLAVTDGLIFNADAINMEDSSSWGEGVKVYGFDDENESGGYRDNALYFDGINDYITIDGNLNVDKEITLEFYGNIEKCGNNRFSFVPLFSAYNGKNSGTAGLCMRMFSYHQNTIVTNFGYNSCGNKDVWEGNNAQHNLAIRYNIKLNQDVMFTATYNYENSIYKIYSDGQIIKEAKISQSYWENFRTNDIPSIKYFQIGKSMWNAITEYFTGKMYSARIYNRTLTDSEVLENYEKTVAYHKIENSK